MIVLSNIRQPYLRQQLNVEFLIASLAETFPFTCLFSDIIVLFLSNQDSLKYPLERIRRLVNHFHTEKKY